MFLLTLLLELVNVAEGIWFSEHFAVDCGKDLHSGPLKMKRCLGPGDGEEGDSSDTWGFSLLLNSSVAVRTKQEKCGEEGVFVILLMFVSLFMLNYFQQRSQSFYESTKCFPKIILSINY